MQVNRRVVLLTLAALGAPRAARAQAADFAALVAQGAEARCRTPEVYDPAYRVIGYPMGDVPDDRGVCADTVIRAFRAGGADRSPPRAQFGNVLCARGRNSGSK
jgi:uncharacterized protein YijF (DUF1287 family)